MTEAEYLTFADAQTHKHEYRGGRVYAMIGDSFRRAAITANAITHLSFLKSSRMTSFWLGL
jgi:hypothetical protein